RPGDRRLAVVFKHAPDDPRNVLSPRHKIIRRGLDRVWLGLNPGTVVGNGCACRVLHKLPTLLVISEKDGGSPCRQPITVRKNQLGSRVEGHAERGDLYDAGTENTEGQFNRRAGIFQWRQENFADRIVIWE